MAPGGLSGDRNEEETSLRGEKKGLGKELKNGSQNEKSRLKSGGLDAREGLDLLLSKKREKIGKKTTRFL